MSGGGQGSFLVWFLLAAFTLSVVGLILALLVSGGEPEVAEGVATVAAPVSLPEPEAVPEVVTLPVPEPEAVAPAGEVPPPEGTGRCKDSDGGEVLELAGLAFGEDAQGDTFLEQDRCLDARNLLEFWCVDGALKQSTFDCLGEALAARNFRACEGGRCAPGEGEGASAPAPEEADPDPGEPIPEGRLDGPSRSPVRHCEDSDHGGKLYRLGHTTGVRESGRPFNLSDRCINGRKILEYWCERGQLVEQVFDCLDPKFASWGFRACRSGTCVR